MSLAWKLILDCFVFVRATTTSRDFNYATKRAEMEEIFQVRPNPVYENMLN